MSISDGCWLRWAKQEQFGALNAKEGTERLAKHLLGNSFDDPALP